MTVEKRPSVADELRAAKRCQLRALLDKMPDDLRAEYVEVLEDAEYSTNSIRLHLEKNGYVIARDPILRCRKNCTCGAFKSPSLESA